MKALRLIISGRVQSVWFRASTREEAQRLGIIGWVRNMPDGSVEIHIQGTEEAVEQMLEWCRQGPPGARVDFVDITDALVEKEFRSFSIRYY